MSFYHYINNFRLVFDDFEVKEDKSTINILPYLFTPSERLYSFPPSGIIEQSEIEHYLTILFKGKVIGFYKIIDLSFENKIELHGSFAKSNTFLVKSYILLTIAFINKIVNDWPDQTITSIANENNHKVIKFLNYLNFVKYDSNNSYINFYLKKN